MSGLSNSKYMMGEEKLGIFLYFVRTGATSRMLQERFQRSADTISKSVHTVLECLVGAFYKKYVHLPLDQTTPEVKSNPKFYPYFRNCRGAIDGSHFYAWVAAEAAPQYRNRKGFLGRNVLAACNFVMLFIYILSGWEGSASDSKIYEYARERDLAIPVGEYYLADAGFPLCDALLTPYCGVRYHLKEWGTANQKYVSKIEL
ncbi:unnamed protein product [Mycena citricolor]|uniref:DDE Tnp4 domain-containing protein n=1 Tax=Mycena citricolor TaxID=2018698 RepID=A0AAD2H7I5_9AGAR|nr:unnamed protein product [Mycena citricolor]